MSFLFILKKISEKPKNKTNIDSVVLTALQVEIKRTIKHVMQINQYWK